MNTSMFRLLTYCAFHILCIKTMLERTLSLGLGAGDATSRIPIENVAEAQLEICDHQVYKQCSTPQSTDPRKQHTPQLRHGQAKTS